MANPRNRSKLLLMTLGKDGITGLETAIVLIAFVVVAAVFAFTVLTTGLFTSEKAKETALAGVAATSSSIAIKGSVTAWGEPGADGGQAAGAGDPLEIDRIAIKLTTAGDTDPVSFEPTGVMITYQDDANVELAGFGDGAGQGVGGTLTSPTPTDPELAVCRGTAGANLTGVRWCLSYPNSNQTPPDNLLEPGETAEIYIFTNSLGVALRDNRQFRIEIIPQEGSPLVFQRRTPISLTPVMSLN